MENILKLALFLLLVFATFLLYTLYKANNVPIYELQNGSFESKKPDTFKSSTAETKIQENSNRLHLTERSDSPLIVHSKVSDSAERITSYKIPVISLADKKENKPFSEDDRSNIVVVNTPSYFTHEYLIMIEKATQVNIMAVDTMKKSGFIKLISIKVDDIIHQKVRFTIENALGVPLHAKTGYLGNGKIVLKERGHDIDISVLKVNKNSAYVKIGCYIDADMAGKRNGQN